MFPRHGRHDHAIEVVCYTHILFADQLVGFKRGTIIFDVFRGYAHFCINKKHVVVTLLVRKNIRLS
jgi:hypothetical protein